MAKPPPVIIDPRLKTSSVTVIAEPLVIDLDPEKLVDGPAEAMAKAVASGVRTAGWHVTGRLAAGITAQDGQVIAPTDRLVRDPELVEKLVEDVPALQRPLEPESVQKAIEKAMDRAVRVGKRASDLR
ncbi:MAG: hypothetical protein SFX73_38565 [Kofleriaceae bacterium]|nr:hypothetical protein [Kofleriaceae bacterium]